LPRPELPGFDTVEPNFVGTGAPGQTLDVDYDVEGSDLGYRWFARQGLQPLFPFGYGLSFTTFAHEGLTVVREGDRLTARFTVRNTGARAGADVAQVYLADAAGRPMRRLAGFAKVELAPGEAREVEVPLEWRTIAEWQDGRWTIAPGVYRFVLAPDALADGPSAIVKLRRRWNAS
jgi:beta-glucosidase